MGSMTYHAGATWEAPVRQEAGARGKCGQELLSQFSWEGTGSAERVGLLLSGLDHLPKLHGVGAVPSWLVPDFGVSMAGKEWS